MRRNENVFELENVKILHCTIIQVDYVLIGLGGVFGYWYGICDAIDRSQIGASKAKSRFWGLRLRNWVH